jgi:hypothetical protein
VVQQNTVNARLVYENAKKNLTDAQVSIQAAKLTQSFLRLENQLIIGKTQFQFPVLNNQPNFSGVIFPTEQRLNQQDSFVAAMWGVYVSNPASNTDATFILHSFPNPQVFTPADAAPLETIYNSYFQLAVNNDIILPAWDVSRHRLVPFTQGGILPFTAATILPEDQIDLSSDGFFPVEPNIVFIGSKNSVLNLLMPAALTAVAAFERLTIIFRGVLAQNSTIIT